MRRRNKETHHAVALPLEVKGVTFAYTPGTPVLQDVTVTVPASSLTCLIGPNGGGKSTLLRLILGLLEPACGGIRVFGATPHRACSWVGYVPQQMEVRPDFPITVREVVGMGCGRLHRIGAHRRACRDGIEQAMERADVASLRHQPFARLSGGQRRRVLIARAMASGPRLLLLDEPTAGVDPVYNEQFRRLLGELKNDLAVVVVSHDLTFTGPDADQVVFVDRSARRLDPGDLDSEWVGRLYRRPDGEGTTG